MENLLCPHCHQLSEDLEFCEHCGRAMENSQPQTVSVEEETYWSQGTLNCDTYIRTQFPERMLELPSVIESPIYTEQLTDGRVKLYFPQKGKQPLSELIKMKTSLSFGDIKDILKQMAKIFTAIHEAGYVVGSFDLADFWGEDLEDFRLRPVRIICPKGTTEKQEDCGEFFAPEMQTNRALEASADVFLLGNLFLSFVFQRMHSFSDYNELRYLSHQLQAFHPEIPLTIHTWLEKSTNLSPEKRYSSVLEQMDAFIQTLFHYERRTSINNESCPSFCIGVDTGTDTSSKTGIDLRSGTLIDESIYETSDIESGTKAAMRPYSIFGKLSRKTQKESQSASRETGETIPALSDHQSFQFKDKEMLKREEIRHFYFSQYASTDDGEGKRKKAALLGKTEGINEDRFWYGEYNGTCFGFVADGISTSSYGSGALAAELIETEAQQIWEEKKESLQTAEEIHAFLHDFIERANKRIIEEVNKILSTQEEEAPKDIMGSTIVAVIVFQGKLYALSVGDSRLYLYSETDGLQLLFGDENLQNESLANGWLWREIETLDNKSSLTQHLGMGHFFDGTFQSVIPAFTVKEVNVFDGDVVFLCSDGLTDYLHTLGHLDDPWIADQEIHRVFTSYLGDSEAKEPLKAAIEDLIAMANENGGGDNITALAIQVNETSLDEHK